MPIVTDPSKLTKVKLKEELQRYNVKLPPSGAKKQVYVDLYIEHISQLNDPSIFEDETTEPSLDLELEKTESESEEESDSEVVNLFRDISGSVT